MRFPGVSTVVSGEWLSTCTLVRTLAELGHRRFVLSEADEVAIAEVSASLLMKKIHDHKSPVEHLTVPQKMSIRSSVA